MMSFDIVFNLIEEGIITMYLCRIGALNETFKQRYAWIFWITMSISINVVNHFFIYNFMLDIGGFIINTWFLMLFSKDSNLGCIAKSILIHLLLLVSVQIGMLIISCLKEINFVMVDDSMYFKSAVVLSKMILFLGSLIAIKVFRKLGNIIMDKNWISLILAMLCIKTSLEINQNMLITEDISTANILISSFSFSLLFAFMLKIFYDVESHTREEMKNELRISAYEKSVGDYQYLSDKSYELHSIKHDLKKVLSYYQMLLEQGEIEKAKSYLSEYTERIHDIYLPIVVEEPIINMVLNEKITQARRKQLDIKYMILSEKLKQLQIEDVDLYILLENTINNAIEHCETNGCIHINMTDEGKFVKVCISNSIKESILQTNSDLHTTKENKIDHGYGVAIIKEIMKKIHGEISFYEEVSMFFCELHLPINDR